MPACARPGVYVPRQTHVRRHLPGFLARLEEAGHALPEKAELEGFARCGDFERGFVRTACRTCGDELRVPFACEGRGFCPSCMGRRMAECPRPQGRRRRAIRLPCRRGSPRPRGCQAIGRADGIVDRYFAISGERRLKHPGVVAISAAARAELFA